MNKMFRIVKSNKKSVVSALALVAVGSANAAADITPVTAAGADVATVGAAVFAVIVAAAAFKWIRRAL